MAVLDSINEVAEGEFCDWKYSSSIFYSGYKFRLAIARKPANVVAGIQFEGSALDFVQLHQEEGDGRTRTFVEMGAGTQISARRRKKNKLGIRVAGKESAKVLPLGGPIAYRCIRSNNLTGVFPVEKTSVLAGIFPRVTTPSLSQHLREAGYLREDGYLHLIATISLGVGLAERKREGYQTTLNL